MCTTALALSDVISGSMNVIKTVSGIKQQDAQYKYQTQIAINNAKQAQNEAFQQKQIGIDEARLEKIKGLRQVNEQIAKNSSSGFDVNSLTNQLNYGDILTTANNSSSLVKSKYFQNANSYLQSANSYLDKAKQIKKEYNDNLFEKGMTYLGQFGKVADSWNEFSK